MKREGEATGVGGYVEREGLPVLIQIWCLVCISDSSAQTVRMSCYKLWLPLSKPRFDRVDSFQFRMLRLPLFLSTHLPLFNCSTQTASER